MATYYRPGGFKRAIIQTLGSQIVGDSATDTFTADAPHNLAVGDAVAPIALGGLSSIALLTRYFVVATPGSTTLKVSATYGGSPIALGSGVDVTFVPLVETRFYLANKATFNASTATKTWEGDDIKIEQESINGLKVLLEFDAVNVSAHAAAFAHTGVGVTLPGGIKNAFGVGGGNDVGGASCGIRLESDAIKVVNGVESAVTFFRWLPMATLSLTKPGDFQTSQKMGTTQYSATIARTKVDLFGASIPNASSDGDFYFEGDNAS